jgi:hypothetical protein
MQKSKLPPGPSAHGAFRFGMQAAAVAALAVIGALYWFGVLVPVLAGFTLLLLFPIYLVLVASALSVWLGYDKDASDLRPVYREKKTS